MQPPPAIPIVQVVPFDRISNLLCSAFDPGYASTRYWAERMEKIEPTGWIYEDTMRPDGGGHWVHEYPLSPGGALMIKDTEDESRGLLRLDFNAVKNGLEVMARDYPKRFAEMMNEDDDGETADCLVQCALFGSMIYG